MTLAGGVLPGSIFQTLAVPSDSLSPAKVQVFHAQPDTSHEVQTPAVEKLYPLAGCS